MRGREGRGGGVGGEKNEEGGREGGWARIGKGGGTGDSGGVYWYVYLSTCLRYPTAASVVRARTMSMVSADRNWLPVADRWRPRRAGGRGRGGEGEGKGWEAGVRGERRGRGE